MANVVVHHDKVLRDRPFQTSALFGGGEGSKICQICLWIVVKNCRRKGGRGQKLWKFCRHLKWTVPDTQWRLECPRLWRITDLSLAVNKQGQRTMKMAMKIFLTFLSFRIHGRKQQNSEFLTSIILIFHVKYLKY